MGADSTLKPSSQTEAHAALAPVLDPEHRAVFDHLDQAVLWTSVDAPGLVRIDEMNAAAASWLRCVQDTGEPRLLRDLVPGAFGAEWCDELQHAHLTGQNRQWQWRVKLPDGEQLQRVRIDIVVMRGDDGHAQALVSIVKAIEHVDLHRAMLQISSILDHQPDCIKLIGEDGTLLHLNRAGMDMLAVATVEEANRIGLENFVHAEDRDAFLDMRRAVCGGERTLLRFRIQGSDGTARHVESTASPLYDAGSGRISMLAITRDLTSHVSDLAARRQAELDALRADERWRFAIDGSGDGVWDWDIEGDRVTYSPRWGELLGETSEAIGNSPRVWLDRLHPDERDALTLAVQRHLDGQTPSYLAEHRLRCKDGRWKWFLGRGLVVSRDAVGRATRMIGTNTDIDTMKQHAEHVVHLRDRLTLAVKGSGFGVWELDLAAERLIWDRRMHLIYGKDPDSFDGDPEQWRQCLHPADRPLVDAQFAALMGGQSVELFEYRIFRADDGAERWIEANGYLQRNAAGAPERLVGMNRDITERKQARAQLIQSEARYHSVVSSLTEGVVVLSSEGNITAWNSAAEQLLGKNAQQMRSSPELQAIREDGMPFPSAQLPGKRALLTGQSEAMVVMGIRRPDQTLVWLSVNATPILEGTAPMPSSAVVSFFDITARKAAEDEIRALNAELERRVIERTEQLEVSNAELRTFTYSVSHDLRAPLRGIDGWSQALVEDCSHLLDHVGRAHLQRIRHETQRMAALVEGLLRLARVAQLELALTDVDLSEMCATILRQLLDEHPNRRLAVWVQPGLHVRGDSSLLFLTLSNLLDNACKFTARTTNAQVHVSGRLEAEALVVAVRDNGIGFDMAHAGELFLPFKRLHRESDFPGTGIGLAICDRIMRRHGGSISVNSRLGGGTVFELTFTDQR